MTRGVMAVLSGIGLIIVFGLILGHSKEFTSVENTTFSGVGSIIKDLQTLPGSGTHK
jgi:hypothetical protein